MALDAAVSVSLREAEYYNSIQNVLMALSLNRLATGLRLVLNYKPHLEREEITLIFKDPLIYRLRGDSVASLE